jgi:hypothetical protein
MAGARIQHRDRDTCSPLPLHFSCLSLGRDLAPALQGGIELGALVDAENPTTAAQEEQRLLAALLHDALEHRVDLVRLDAGLGVDVESPRVRLTLQAAHLDERLALVVRHASRYFGEWLQIRDGIIDRILAFFSSSHPYKLRTSRLGAAVSLRN